MAALVVVLRCCVCGCTTNVHATVLSLSPRDCVGLGYITYLLRCDDDRSVDATFLLLTPRDCVGLGYNITELQRCDDDRSVGSGSGSGLVSTGQSVPSSSSHETETGLTNRVEQDLREAVARTPRRGGASNKQSHVASRASLTNRVQQDLREAVASREGVARHKQSHVARGVSVFLVLGATSHCDCQCRHSANNTFLQLAFHRAGNLKSLSSVHDGRFAVVPESLARAAQLIWHTLSLVRTYRTLFRTVMSIIVILYFFKQESELSSFRRGKTSVSLKDSRCKSSLLSRKRIAEENNPHVCKPWFLIKSSSRPSCFPNTECSWKFAPQNVLLGPWMFADMGSRTNLALFPAFRYLPDPTLDPAVDFAHAGYRLASFSAFPATVTVSRVRLADAGFYYRGEGDEVVCYSCEARRSGWRQGDNPLEVHRRLSPRCQHVANRDRELATVVSLGAYDTGGGSSLFNDARLSSGTVTSAGDRSNTRTADSQPSTRAAVIGEARTSGGSSLLQHTLTPLAASNISEDGGAPASAAVNPTPSITQPAVLQSETTDPRTSVASQAASNAPVRSSAPSGSASGQAPARGVRSDGNSTFSTSPANVSGVASATGSSVTSSAPTTGSGGLQASSASTSASPDDSSQSSRSPRPGGGGSGSEGRPLFPRAGLDLGGAVYPMYQDMQSRRRTFTTWDETQAPPLDLIILCGMFYAGYADCVRCFYCGVGLKHWLPTDDVWTEHVRWRPGCQYLRAVKGDEFIGDTQRRLALQGGSRVPYEASGNHSNVAAAPQQTSDGSVVVSPAVPTPTTTPSTTSTSPTHSASATAGPVRLASGHSLSPATARTGGGEGQSQQGATSAANAADGSSNDAERSRIVSGEAEDQESVARLQAENEALAQRLRCRVCRAATVDTILMPCGHLVCCEPCARSVTSCPLCHAPIRATARVHMS